MSKRTAMKLSMPIIGVGALLAVSACSGDGGSSTYPESSVQVTVPYAPGGGTDLAARALTGALQESVGQSFVVTNQAGGGGTVALAENSGAEPDGYSGNIAIDSNLTLQPTLNTDLGYSYEDFDSIAFAQNSFILVAGADAPYDNLSELIEAAEQDPGEIRIGTPGDASANDMAARAFANEAGVTFRQVPFGGGGADANNAVLAGNVELASTTTTVAQGLVDSGDFKIIGTLAEEPALGAESSDTLDSVGIDASAVNDVMIYLSVPTGAPEDVLSTLENAVEALGDDDAFLSTLEGLGQEFSFLSVDESRQDLENRDELYQTILDDVPELGNA